MDRIERIRELESTTEDYDARRWEAAHLIAQEVTDGRLRVDIAQEIGKSPMHVTFMVRCWEFITTQLPPPYVYAELGSFRERYASAEVRTPADRERRVPRTKRATTQTAQSDGDPAETIHDFVRICALYADAIANASPADKAELSPAERDRLRTAISGLTSVTAKKRHAA